MPFFTVIRRSTLGGMTRQHGEIVKLPSGRSVRTLLSIGRLIPTYDKDEMVQCECGRFWEDGVAKEKHHCLESKEAIAV